MSSLPPEIPDQVTPTPADAGSVLAEIWQTIFPWADLNAKGIVERFLHLGTEILATLTVMVGQSPQGPKLVRTRIDGSLAAGAILNDTTLIAAPVLLGATSIQVVDVSVFRPSQVVQLQKAGTGAAELVFVKGTVLPSTLNLMGGTGQTYAVGDFAMPLPVVGIFGQPVAVGVAASTAPGKLALVQSPVDFSGTINAGASSTLVSGVAGTVIYGFYLMLGADAAVGASGIQLTESGGNSTARFPLGVGPWNIDLKGGPVASVGGTSQLKNTSAANATVRGCFVWGQA